MTEAEQLRNLRLISLQAQSILMLAAMLQRFTGLMSEEELKVVSLSKSGAYAALGIDQE